MMGYHLRTEPIFITPASNPYKCPGSTIKEITMLAEVDFTTSVGMRGM
jgi:hypothetical protein